MRSSVGMIGALLLAAGGASTRKQIAERECTDQVAREMGYDVNPNGDSRSHPGAQSAPGAKIQGSGARIAACL